MMGMFISVFLVQCLLFSSTLLVFTRFGSAASQGVCNGTKYCSNKKLGPPIWPPFWVQDTQQPAQQPAADHSCCYPEFEISCSSSNGTLLLHPLPSFPSLKFQVIKIDYQLQEIQVVSLQGGDCFPLQLLNLSLSASPFRFSSSSQVNYLHNFDLYSCSSPPLESYDSYVWIPVPCLNVRGIYTTRSDSYFSYGFGRSCTKLGTIASVSSSIFTIVGLWCIQWNPVDRPSMKIVIQMLEGDTDSLAIPPNPFSTRNASRP